MRHPRIAALSSANFSPLFPLRDCFQSVFVVVDVINILTFFFRRCNKIIINIMISTFLTLYVASKHKNIIIYVRCDLPQVDVHNDGKITVRQKWILKLLVA